MKFIELFPDRTYLDETSGCHLFQNRVERGSITIGGKTWRVSRLAWVLENGPIPEGMSVCHRCDRPGCCNTEHHFLGTNLDNVADMVSKGRQARGERQREAKLQEADVKYIRSHDLSLDEIMRLYGLSRPAACKVRNGTSWKHLPR